MSIKDLNFKRDGVIMISFTAPMVVPRNVIADMRKL